MSSTVGRLLDVGRRRRVRRFSSSSSDVFTADQSSLNDDDDDEFDVLSMSSAPSDARRDGAATPADQRRRQHYAGSEFTSWRGACTGRQTDATRKRRRQQMNRTPSLHDDRELLEHAVNHRHKRLVCRHPRCAAVVSK